MHPSRSRSVLMAMLLSAAAPVPAAEPFLAPGASVASGDSARFSLQAREVSPESLRLNVRAQTGLTIVAPGDSRISVEFADLPAREGAARIGAALGGLVPLHASWADATPGARSPRVDAYYLVRPGSRRQQLLEAYALEQSGVAHRHLRSLLETEGAALVPDAVAHARDATRGERERAMSIQLLASFAVPEAAAALFGLLRDEPQPLLREAASIALGWAGRPEAVPALKRALDEPDTQVALSAAWALVRLGDLSGVPLALAHLRDRRGNHALRALDVIAETRDPAHLGALEAALTEVRGLERIRTRTTIADLAMARLDEAGKIAACERLLADADFEVRRHGAKALARLGTPAAEAALDRIAADRARDGAGDAAEAAARLRRSRIPPPQITID